MAGPRPLRPLRAQGQPAHHRRLGGDQPHGLPQRRFAAGRGRRGLLHRRHAVARCVLRGIRARRHRLGRHSLAQLGGDVSGRLRALHRRRARRPLRHPRPARRRGAVALGSVAHLRLQRAALHHQPHAQRLAGEPRPAHRRRRHQPDQLRRGRFLVPAEHQQLRRLALLRHGAERHERRLRPGSARGALPHPPGRGRFVPRLRRRGRGRQSGQPGLPGLPAGRCDRQVARQLGRLRRRGSELHRPLHDGLRGALRGLQRLRQHARRQDRRRFPRHRHD